LPDWLAWDTFDEARHPVGLAERVPRQPVRQHREAGEVAEAGNGVGWRAQLEQERRSGGQCDASCRRPPEVRVHRSAILSEGREALVPARSGYRDEAAHGHRFEDNDERVTRRAPAFVAAEPGRATRTRSSAGGSGVPSSRAASAWLWATRLRRDDRAELRSGSPRARAGSHDRMPGDASDTWPDRFEWSGSPPGGDRRRYVRRRAAAAHREYIHNIASGRRPARAVESALGATGPGRSSRRTHARTWWVQVLLLRREVDGLLPRDRGAPFARHRRTPASPPAQRPCTRARASPSPA